ncbi:thiamine phosphate synthase [Sphingosinicella microcystinivorans]|uniref:thiamine phosphate synthase n=1 Tax=Sphingosinicella microcystinivorans TaxID=335406 RepID=UPI0022F39CA4|nr:thiamine phosphate synthase [Sphingosinicella microcystinivorans]WBX85547.1 thiamine phosphate synthase [Sphingosinicella microcystinivorans]
MRRRHSRQPLPETLPEIWLFTDPRMGEALWDAIRRLPRGSGVVLRHYGAADRRAIAKRAAALARRHGHMLVVAGDARLARAVGAAGVHMPDGGRPARDVITAASHDRAGLVRARRAGARLVFLSPVFPTRSHPGARTLGPLRFGLMARGAGIAVAALGGMNRERYARMQPLGAQAWGAIDAWL